MDLHLSDPESMNSLIKNDECSRLRLGANELSDRHRSNIRELVNELQINCREYAKLDGRGDSDRRKTAVR